MLLQEMNTAHFSPLLELLFGRRKSHQTLIFMYIKISSRITTFLISISVILNSEPH